jgi:phage baseplate assembly protein W
MSTIKIPFSIAESGRVSRVIDQNVIARQLITDVLVTSKLERTARPDYGAGAMELLYEPVDDLIYSEFRTDAAMEVNKHVSSAALMSLSVGPAQIPYFADQLSNTLEVTAQYRTAGSGVQSFTVKLSNPELLDEESLI